MRYFVRVYRAGDSYSAMAPDLPGCVAAADTVEEVRDLMAEAIALHIDMLRRSGDPIPKPTKRFEFRADDADREEFCAWIDIPPVKKVLQRYEDPKRKQRRYAGDNR